MKRGASLALLCLSLFLLVFPLTLEKPGIPTGLKADEPAYYLMALSLARDGDLRCQKRDIARLFDEFPFGPVRNLILMSDDGWRTIYFGKPYVYSLFAAPFAALAGADGMVFFNMLLIVAMIWMGYRYLARESPAGLAALFAAGFFVLGSGFAYAFWLHPEVFSMAADTGSLFLAFRPGGAESAPRSGWAAAAVSGALLALAVYNKPMLALLGLPVLFALLRRRRFAPAAAWLLGAAVSLTAVAGLATALTGHPSAYLGVARQGVTVCSPDESPTAALRAVGAIPPVTAQEGAASSAKEESPPQPTAPAVNSWGWLLRLPRIIWSELFENLGYFLWGRHTGLLLYMPFAVAAVLLFLFDAWRDPDRWALVAGLALVALSFLVLVPFNWHGGGGFIGNRYFVNAYPAFLFLVRRIRPAWSLPGAYAYAGLFLAPILLTPFGAWITAPTLQAHTRSWPYRIFPLELSIRHVPGYVRVNYADLRATGREDLVLPRGDRLWLRGASRVELWLERSEPTAAMAFLIDNTAPGNVVDLEMGDARAHLDFTGAGATKTRRVELAPSGPSDVRSQDGRPVYVYHLLVRSRTGRTTPWVRVVPPPACPQFGTNAELEDSFFLGAKLTYLGPRGVLDRDLYALEWGACSAPSPVAAASRFTAHAEVVNRSRETWGAAPGAARVRLSYHWLDAAGAPVVWEGVRTELPRPVAPGEHLMVDQEIEAPPDAGSYVLALDPVYEFVAWFSARNGGLTCRRRIDVVPAPPSDAAGGGR